MNSTDSKAPRRETSDSVTREPGHKPIRHYSTDELFGPNVEIVIDHNGQRYRLRITRQGKLILTK